MTSWLVGRKSKFSLRVWFWKAGHAPWKVPLNGRHRLKGNGIIKYKTHEADGEGGKDRSGNRVNVIEIFYQEAIKQSIKQYTS